MEFGLKTNHQMDSNSHLQQNGSWRPGTPRIKFSLSTELVDCFIIIIVKAKWYSTGVAEMVSVETETIYIK